MGERDSWKASTDGFDRAAVEAYMAAIERRRSHLRSVIADARVRSSRARQALEMRQVFMAMLTEACDELSAKRRQAGLVVRSTAALSQLDSNDATASVAAESRVDWRAGRAERAGDAPTRGTDDVRPDVRLPATARS